MNDRLGAKVVANIVRHAFGAIVHPALHHGEPRGAQIEMGRRRRDH